MVSCDIEEPGTECEGAVCCVAIWESSELMPKRAASGRLSRPVLNVGIDEVLVHVAPADDPCGPRPSPSCQQLTNLLVYFPFTQVAGCHLLLNNSHSMHLCKSTQNQWRSAQPWPMGDNLDGPHLQRYDGMQGRNCHYVNPWSCLRHQRKLQALRIPLYA